MRDNHNNGCEGDYPRKGLEFLGVLWGGGGGGARGVLLDQTNKRNVNSLTGISRGLGDVIKNPFRGRGMDILCNYTMFTFCDVTHDIQQNKKHKQTLESAQYRLEIIFNRYHQHL